MAGRAANQRAQPGQQLFHIERFCQVVVGTRIHAGHLLIPAVAGGEYQHRKFVASPPPFFEHAEAITLGQAKIEHHRVIGLGVAEKVPLFAIGCRINRIASLAQSLDELAFQVRIIFDDEKPHAGNLAGLGQRCRKYRSVAAAALLGKWIFGVNGQINQLTARLQHHQFVGVGIARSAQADLDEFAVNLPLSKVLQVLGGGQTVGLHGRRNVRKIVGAVASSLRRRDRQGQHQHGQT